MPQHSLGSRNHDTAERQKYRFKPLMNIYAARTCKTTSAFATRQALMMSTHCTAAQLPA